MYNIISYLLILFMHFANSFFIQDPISDDEKFSSLKNNVVKIYCDHIKGTGLVVGIKGTKNDSCFILTANHNIPDTAKNLEIDFFTENDSCMYQSKKIKKVFFDATLDAALITARLPSCYKAVNFQRINIAKKSSFRSENRVKAIAHTTRMNWNIVDKLEIGEIQKHRFKISADGLTTGCSGAPVFDTANCLLGIIYQEFEKAYWVVNFYDIIRKCRNPVSYFNLINLSTEPNMEFIPGGKYKINEKQDTVISPFLLDKHEVTNLEFANFLNSYDTPKNKNAYKLFSPYKGRLIKSKKDNKWRPKKGYENYPVVFVSWVIANKYAKWAGKRLPTEVEWEYAAKGGKNLQYATSLANYENYYSVNVGSYKPNPFGLYDMTGNVWEWCSDTLSGGWAIIKGGAWTSPIKELNICYKQKAKIWEQFKDVGFRCAKDF